VLVEAVRRDKNKEAYEYERGKTDKSRRCIVSDWVGGEEEKKERKKKRE
jgi:hypothetical protein